jgi:CBS domain-containing protein
MKIKDVMTKKPVSLKPTDTLHDVLRVLVNKKISGCPVINAQKNVVGIVTQSDILKMVDMYSNIQKTDDVFSIIETLLTSEDESLRKEVRRMKSRKVKDFMKKNIITIDINDDLYKAARLINKNNIDRLPVVRSKKLVGIITKKDILRVLEKME